MWFVSAKYQFALRLKWNHFSEPGVEGKFVIFRLLLSRPDSHQLGRSVKCSFAGNTVNGTDKIDGTPLCSTIFFVISFYRLFPYPVFYYNGDSSVITVQRVQLDDKNSLICIDVGRMANDRPFRSIRVNVLYKIGNATFQCEHVRL